MKSFDYSQQIAQAIRSHLDEKELIYTFHEDIGIIEYQAGIPCRVKFLHFFVKVLEDSFTVKARIPLGPDPDNGKEIAEMALFLTRANSLLRNGNFEMDLDDGEISYRVHCNCSGVTVSEEMISESLHLPGFMCIRFIDGIQGVLFEGLSEQEAHDRCEQKSRDALEKHKAQLRRILEEKEEDEQEEQTPDKSEGFDRLMQFLRERAASQAEAPVLPIDIPQLPVDDKDANCSDDEWDEVADEAPDEIPCDSQ